MDALTSFFGRAGLIAHGYCIAWSPGLLWSMVASDAVISLAYFSIPVTIVSFVRRRDDVSIVTAVVLWRLIPQALKIPSVARLQAAIGSLEAEIGKRRGIEEHLLDVEQSPAATLASIEAGFIATDRQGRVTRMNTVAEAVTGWPQLEAAGRSTSWNGAACRLFGYSARLDAQRLEAENRQHDGTGLGLALTRRLVQAQGGSVGVRSTPGVGSVFHLVLRRVPDTTLRGHSA